MSDTEIHAVHPPLAAGTYDVHVLNAQGIDRTRAALVVVDPPPYAPAALTYPVGANRFPRCLQYDAERRPLIVGVLFNDATMNSSQLLRYTHTSENDHVRQWLAAHRLEQTAAIIKRLRKAVQSGELRRDVDPVVLGEYLAAVMNCLSVHARDGVSKKRLLALSDLAVTSVFGPER